MRKKSKSESMTSESDASLMFEDFDFTNFWQSEEDLSEENRYVDPIYPTDEIIAEVEKRLGGYRLPKAYIELCRHPKSQNGGALDRMCCPLDTKTSTPSSEKKKPAPKSLYITAILPIGWKREYSLAGDMGSDFWKAEWGYPPKHRIYFGDGPSAGHDMFCFDYNLKDNSSNKDIEKVIQREPKVVHISQEMNYKETIVANNFEEFIRKLQLPPTEGQKDNESTDKENADQEEEQSSKEIGQTIETKPQRKRKGGFDIFLGLQVFVISVFVAQVAWTVYGMYFPSS